MNICAGPNVTNRLTVCVCVYGLSLNVERDAETDRNENYMYTNIALNKGRRANLCKREWGRACSRVFGCRVWEYLHIYGRSWRVGTRLRPDVKWQPYCIVFAICKQSTHVQPRTSSSIESFILRGILRESFFLFYLARRVDVWSTVDMRKCRIRYSHVIRHSGERGRTEPGGGSIGAATFILGIN